MKIILLADPAMKGSSVRDALDIRDFDSFEQWKDEAFDSGVSPEIMFVGNRLIVTGGASSMTAYDALQQMFDASIYPHLIVLTSPNPLEQLRQTKLLKVMGYTLSSPCTWLLAHTDDLG